VVLNPLKTESYGTHKYTVWEEREREIESRRVLGEVRDTLFWGGERASFCKKVPRLRPLVLLIRVE
jgi:hypothetical protein